MGIYTFVNLQADEHPNEAVRANYTSIMDVKDDSHGIHIQHSSMFGDCTRIPRFPLNTVVLGLAWASTKTAEQASKTIKYAGNALRYLNGKRSLYGALQNRMEHTYSNNQNRLENVTAAESRIRDTEYPEEMVKLSASSIIVQASQSMLAQSNRINDSVLSLLK